jgi:hypothetical protein
VKSWKREGGKELKQSAQASAADPVPDKHGSAFILVGWIRIRIGNMDPDPDPGGPK